MLWFTEKDITHAVLLGEKGSSQFNNKTNILTNPNQGNLTKKKKNQSGLFKNAYVMKDKKAGEQF